LTASYCRNDGNGFNNFWEPNTVLSEKQHHRYIRQLNLPDFGVTRQQRLLKSRVVIVGAGGLGCPIALYLAAAGVGSLVVVDDDSVTLSNLHRQIAYSCAEIGLPKSEQLVQALERLDSELDFTAVVANLSECNYETLLAGANLVIDGTDNFASRFLLADACHFLKISYLQTAVFQYSAQIMLCTPGFSPCYRCVFEAPPKVDELQPCSQAGVLGSAVGTAGTIAATEAIKFLSGMQSAVLGKMLIYDGIDQAIRHVELSFDDKCRLCGNEASIKTVERYPKICLNEVAGEKNEKSEKNELSVEEANLLISQGATLIDVRETNEFRLNHLAGAISVPHSKIEEKLDELQNLKTPVLLYCQQGKRSQLFLQRLEAQGFNGFFALRGGLQAWYG